MKGSSNFSRSGRGISQNGTIGGSGSEAHGTARPFRTKFDRGATVKKCKKGEKAMLETIQTYLALRTGDATTADRPIAFVAKC